MTRKNIYTQSNIIRGFVWELFICFTKNPRQHGRCKCEGEEFSLLFIFNPLMTEKINFLLPIFYIFILTYMYDSTIF